jgi:hypothetical protein
MAQKGVGWKNKYGGGLWDNGRNTKTKVKV